MNKGGLIKMYVKKECLNEADVAAAVGVPKGALDELYQSQTVDADIKKKLQGYFNKNIFDSSLLTEFNTNVPDEQDHNAKK